MLMGRKWQLDWGPLCLQHLVRIKGSLQLMSGCLQDSQCHTVALEGPWGKRSGERAQLGQCSPLKMQKTGGMCPGVALGCISVE